MNIGEKIKALRKQKGITQTELGKKCEISQVQIARYENGVNRPSQKVLKKIASGMEVPVNFFDDIYSINDNVLDAEYDRLKKVLVKDEYKYALSKIFKSFYITCQAEMPLNED